MSTRALTKHIAVSFVVLCLLGVGLIAQAQRIIQDGPGVMDLRFWLDREGHSLGDVNQGHSMALVVLVDPKCDTCAKLSDDMEELRERAKKAGIAYYVLMIPDGTDTQKYFTYADSLKINAKAFVWSDPTVKTPVSLMGVTVPSHVLMSTDRFEGRIVNKWAGVPPLTSLAQLKFIEHQQNVIPNRYIVVLNDDVVSKTATIEVRRTEVSAIADSFAQRHGGKVHNIYETALYGFAIELPSKAAAIEISNDPKVKFVEQEVFLTIAFK